MVANIAKPFRPLGERSVIPEDAFWPAFGGDRPVRYPRSRLDTSSWFQPVPNFNILVKLKRLLTSNKVELNGETDLSKMRIAQKNEAGVLAKVARAIENEFNLAEGSLNIDALDLVANLADRIAGLRD